MSDTAHDDALMQVMSLGIEFEQAQMLLEQCDWDPSRVKQMLDMFMRGRGRGMPGMGGGPPGGMPGMGGGMPGMGSGMPGMGGGGLPGMGGGMPGRGLPAGGFPGRGLPSGGMPGRGLPSGGFPGRGLPTGGMPGRGLPRGGMPGRGLPSGGFPGRGLPSGGMPGRGLPSGGMPGRGLPSGGMPGRGLPRGGMPGRGLPSGGMPGRGLPSGGMPGRGLPSGGMPGRGLPSGGMPGRGLPRGGMHSLGGGGGGGPQEEAVRLLTTAKQQLQRQQAGEALNSAQRAIRLAYGGDDLSNPEEWALGLQGFLNDLFEVASRSARGLAKHEEALKYAEAGFNLTDPTELVDCVNLLQTCTISAERLGNTEALLRLGGKMVGICEKLLQSDRGQSDLLLCQQAMQLKANTCMQIAKVHCNANEWHKAHDASREALELFQRLGDEAEIPTATQIFQLCSSKVDSMPPPPTSQPADQVDEEVADFVDDDDVLSIPLLRVTAETDPTIVALTDLLAEFPPVYPDVISRIELLTRDEKAGFEAKLQSVREEFETRHREEKEKVVARKDSPMSDAYVHCKMVLACTSIGESSASRIRKFEDAIKARLLQIHRRNPSELSATSVVKELEYAINCCVCLSEDPLQQLGFVRHLALAPDAILIPDAQSVGSWFGSRLDLRKLSPRVTYVVYHRIENCPLSVDGIRSWVIQGGRVSSTFTPLSAVFSTPNDTIDSLLRLWKTIPESLSLSSVAALQGIAEDRLGQAAAQAQHDQTRIVRTLFDLLIEPILSSLPENSLSPLCFVARSLLDVPFAALQARDGSFLIEKHPVSVCPSLHIAASVQQMRPRREMRAYAVVASDAIEDDDDVGSEDESQEISSVMEAVSQLAAEQSVLAVSYIDRDHFVPEMVMGSCSSLSPQILHVTSRGENLVLPPGADVDIELGSLCSIGDRVVMSRGTGLEGALVARGDVQGSELVFLNCSGSLRVGAGFVHAGWRSVIAPSVGIFRRVAVRLVSEFYRGLALKRMKAEALRAAMLSLLREEELRSNPVTWCSYALIGNPL